jgi:hypothetical protein
MMIVCAELGNCQCGHRYNDNRQTEVFYGWLAALLRLGDLVGRYLYFTEFVFILTAVPLFSGLVAFVASVVSMRFKIH